MTKDREKLFEKVRALLRKAESTEFEAEAEAFFAKAQELMLKWAIDEEELWASEPDMRPVPKIITFDLPARKTGVMAKRIILHGCARANSCRAWYSGSVMSVAGYESDLLFVDMLYTSIVSQMSMSLAFALAKGQHSDVKAFRASFMDGYSTRIYHRLSSVRQEASGTSTSTEIALVSREQQIERFVEQTVGKLHSASRSSRVGSYEGYQQGQSAASKADLSAGKGKVTSRKRDEIGR
jgi:Protein of unknown function (DUF2786)